MEISFQFKFWIHGNKNIEYFFPLDTHLAEPRNTKKKKKKKGDLSSFLLISICFFYHNTMDAILAYQIYKSHNPSQHFGRHSLKVKY